MRYSGYFIFTVFIFSFSGIIIALLNNDFTIERPKNYSLINNNIDLTDETEVKKDQEKIIEDSDKNPKQSEKINNKDNEEEIKKKFEENDKNKKGDEQKNESDKEEKNKKENDKIKKNDEQKNERDKEEKNTKENNEKQKSDEFNKSNEDEQKRKENQGKENIVEKTKSSNIHKYTKDGKIRIACAYALDNTYVFPTLVAMTSLAENASSKTFYDIYVMIGTGFKEENKKILLSVEEKHKEHCKIYFIDMADKFKNADTNQKITTPTYYRLELPSLLPEVNRVIWMDGDTAVFEDLTELITIDMKNNYIMGFLDSLPDAIERFGIKDATVLCAGVLLFDLDALRKNHMQEKMHKFIADNLGKLNQHDQTVINVVCQNHIGPLPPKYGIWSFEAQVYALKHNERQRPWLKYDTQEFINAYHHPAILHYVWPKPFWRRQRPIFNDEWWKYAKISGYYNDVYNKSPKWISNRLLTELVYEKNHYYYL